MPKLPAQRLDRSEHAKPEPPAQIHELLYGLLRDENKQVTRVSVLGVAIEGVNTRTGLKQKRHAVKRE